MPALVAVMIMVSIGTFNWQSVKELKTHPLGFNVVMIATVAIVLYTHNLALGVEAGVLLASLFFANKSVALCRCNPCPRQMRPPRSPMAW